MLDTMRISGAGTALVTPFQAGGDIDERAVRNLVDWQIAEGIHFLVPCGSTGEAATMTVAEQARVVELTAEVADGRVRIVAGAGSNDTARAITLSRDMRAAGATHVLHVSPMYNKPPQRGIIAHFRAVADASPLPVIIYNVPGRTASNILAETTLELAEHPNIVGIKEASGDLAQIGEIIRNRPPGFSVLSGDDALTFAIMAEGGDGVISVTANAAPAMVTAQVEAAQRNDLAAARALHNRLADLTSAVFVESNPIPIKAALALMGLCENVLRLPLVPLAPHHAPRVNDALEQIGALG